MGLSSGLVTVYISAVFVSVHSQIYGQYGYTPYNQYMPGQNLGYNSYQYQPYVSSQPTPYYPYGYPLQSYAPQNYPTYNYPAQTYGYPGQNYQTRSYATQQNYPYYPQYTRPLSSYTPYPYATGVNTNNNSSHNGTGEDPYANIKTEVVDIDPKYFNHYKRFFNLENNAYPIQVIDDNSVGSNAQVQPQSSYGNGASTQQSSPYYIVKTESSATNSTYVPRTINKHEVQSKTFSFKKTYTLDPNKKEDAVIKLNFVNGVQVTTEPAYTYAVNDATDAPTVTENILPTTTENDEPANILSWLR